MPESLAISPFGFRISDFGFPSDFGLRISDFGLRPLAELFKQMYGHPGLVTLVCCVVGKV
jgi:hypothetical protein